MFWGPLVFVLTMVFWAGAFYNSSTAQSVALSSLKKEIDSNREANEAARATSIAGIKKLQAQQFSDTQAQIAANADNTQAQIAANAVNVRELGVNLQLSNSELSSKLAVISRDVQHVVRGLEKLEQRSVSRSSDYPRLYADEVHAPRRSTERN